MDRIETLINEVNAYKEPEHSPEVKSLIEERRNRYSAYNLRLINDQRPGATLVKTISHWKSWGRTLKPSAIPIAVIRPRGPVMYVYDFADTCVDPYGSGKDITDPEVLEFLMPFHVNGPIELDYPTYKANVESYGIITVDDSLDYAYAHGGTAVLSRDSHIEPHKIYLNRNYSEDKNAMTSFLAHEAAHIVLKHGKGIKWNRMNSAEAGIIRAQGELEAEVAAYLVMDRLGVSTIKKCTKYIAQRYRKLNDYLKSKNLDSYGIAIDRDTIYYVAELVTNLFLRQADDEEVRRAIFVDPVRHDEDEIPF